MKLWWPVLVVLAAGCGTVSTFNASPAFDSRRADESVPSDEARRTALAVADFSRAIELRIELRDYGFTPDVLRLRLGQPYRLTVQNIGGHNHYLNAPEFLRRVAVSHVEVRGEVEVQAPWFSRFEVARRGGQFQIDFVPLVRGEYAAHCHLEGDAHRGVHGRIVVE